MQQHIFSTRLQHVPQVAQFLMHKRHVRASAAMQTRRAWHITSQGSMGSLQLVTEPMPALKQQAPEQQQQQQQQQCLVEVKCVGLNLADVFCCLGLYKAAPKGDFVPGLEFSGVVVATSNDDNDDNTNSSSGSGSGGNHHHHFKPGNRVLGVLRFGAFASFLSVPSQYLRRVPDSWSFEQAAAYPVQSLTAAFGLFQCGNVRSGHTVLVQSAAGGVGLQALQILSRLNCSVLGLVGSETKAQLLRDKFGSSSSTAPAGATSQLQGGDHQPQQQPQQPLPPATMEFAVRLRGEQQIRQQLLGFLQGAGKSGFDVVLDSLAGEYFEPSYRALSPCGRHIIFGAGSLTPEPGRQLTLSPLTLLAPASLWALLRLLVGWLRRPRLDVISMPGDNKGVVGFNLIWLYDRLDLLADLYAQLEQLQLEPPLIGRVYDFEKELPAALAFLQSGKSVGKVVCRVNAE